MSERLRTNARMILVIVLVAGSIAAIGMFVLSQVRVVEGFSTEADLK